jgi:hypothetical protein
MGRLKISNQNVMLIMMDIDQLFEQMATLAPDQLESLQQFIATQPYKQQNRPPTDQERKTVIHAIQHAILNAPQEENIGLARLRQEGHLTD